MQNGVIRPESGWLLSGDIPFGVAKTRLSDQGRRGTHGLVHSFIRVMRAPTWDSFSSSCS
jgi:hypothetical protein